MKLLGKSLLVIGVILLGIFLFSSEDIDFPVLTEVVWSIGKLRDDKSVAPIEELNEKIWVIRDTSEAMRKLRDAANVATKMVDLDYQIM